MLSNFLSATQLIRAKLGHKKIQVVWIAKVQFPLYNGTCDFLLLPLPYPGAP